MKSLACLAAALLACPAVVHAQTANTSIGVAYTDYSKAFGSRRIATADVSGLLGSARLSFTLSSGERRFADVKFKGTRVGGSVTNDWTDRLSTRTSVSVASNEPVFARSEIAQDISYKPIQNAVLTVGGKRATYFGGTHVNSWSAGGTYYFRGASVGYRFSAFDTKGLGVSHAHQLNVRVPDPGGRGSTQLWVGKGSSLQDLAWLPTAGRGKYTSVAARRLQPVADGVAFSIAADRTWFDTPTANHTGTTVRIGFDVQKLGFLRTRARP